MLDGIKLWCIRRQGNQPYIFWNNKLSRFMPTSTIKDHNDSVLSVKKRYFFKKQLHTSAVDLWKYQCIKNSIRYGYCSIRIGILMSHHRPTKWASRLGAPASPCVGDPTKSSLILKHHPDLTRTRPIVVYLSEKFREFFFHSFWTSASDFG